MPTDVLLSYSEEDCRCLATALEDALRDLDMYPDDGESLEKVVRSNHSSIALAKRLLGLDTDTHSWKHLMSQANMPEFLASPFSWGRPLYSSKLEALLFMTMQLQQRRLEQKRTDDVLYEMNKSDAESDVQQSDPSATPLELPSFLSEKQKTAIETCYAHLRNDYANRRHGMHKRLSILEANFGGDKVEPMQQDNDARPPFDAQTLLEHFARAHSVGPSATHIVAKAGAAATGSVPVTDRGGRVDDVSRLDTAEWTDERKPTMPSHGGKDSRHAGGNHSAFKGGGHGSRKRGNGDTQKKTSPRKRNNNDSK